MTEEKEKIDEHMVEELQRELELAKLANRQMLSDLAHLRLQIAFKDKEIERMDAALRKAGLRA
jgi:hypothetical protein